MASIQRATNDKMMKDFNRAEQLSVPITLFVLLFAFGALVAALLPVAMAMTAVFGAIGLLAFASHLNPVDQSASSVLLLVGLAVGVDYSLFYVKREREERAKGASPQAALRAAAATSGHSVLISGITVLIAMAGMFLAGDKVFAGIAWGAMLVVALAIVGSLTVLPALLSAAGRPGRARSHPRACPGCAAAKASSRMWGWALDKVLRRPVVAVVVSGGALLALAVPVLGMHTAAPAASDLPQNLPVIQTYNHIQAAFPGGPIPAAVVIQAHDVTAPAVQTGIANLERAALATGQMNPPITTQISPDHHVAVVSIPLAGDGENTASTRALHTLRSEVIPATIGRVPGTTVNVGGLTAANQDWNQSLHTAIPLVFGFVLLLAFVLLLVSFRSLVIAAKAIVLNLLSVGAAYGVLVWIFQDGHLQGLLGFHSTHAITSWLPIFMFVLLFGLSMDYHVFILSRIREGHLAGLRTDSAVSQGIKSIAGTVTAAAVVMVMVFLTFATLSQVSMKEAGIGLATAVLLDATLVRIVLLPASMKLLGKWNWYLPSWLDWIPQIGHEPSLQPVPAPEPAQHPGGEPISMIQPIGIGPTRNRVGGLNHTTPSGSRAHTEPGSRSRQVVPRWIQGRVDVGHPSAPPGPDVTGSMVPELAGWTPIPTARPALHRTGSSRDESGPEMILSDVVSGSGCWCVKTVCETSGTSSSSSTRRTRTGVFVPSPPAGSTRTWRRSW